MQDLYAKITAAKKFLVAKITECPLVGVILGSGLGGVGDAIEIQTAIEYCVIPHFLRSTAIGHSGRLLFGRFGGKPVVAMQGRFHLYEGYAAERAAFPVRVMQALGIRMLVVSNAAGGLNPQFSVGDIMVIDDHVNLMNRNPLIGMNDDRLGARFPDMSAPYDRQLGDLALAAARKRDIACQRGTYVGVLGPNYETRAEIRMLRIWGDVVGMSTVPEVIVAAHAGLHVLGLSTITNICSPDVRHEASGDEVVAVANAASQKLGTIVRHAISGFEP